MLYFLSRKPLVFPGEPAFKYRQNVKDKINNIINEDLTDNNEINDLRTKLSTLPEPTPLDENFVNSFMLPIRFAFSKIGFGEKFNEYQSYFKTYLNIDLIESIEKYEELVTNLKGITDWAGVTGVTGAENWTNLTGAGWTGVTDDMYLVNRKPFDFSDDNINTSYLDLKGASGNLLLATFNCNKDIDTIKTFTTKLTASEKEVAAFFDVKNVYRDVVTSYDANVKGYDTTGTGCVGCTGCMKLEESKTLSGSAPRVGGTRGRGRGGGGGRGVI